MKRLLECFASMTKKHTQQVLDLPRYEKALTSHHEFIPFSHALRPFPKPGETHRKLPNVPPKKATFAALEYLTRSPKLETGCLTIGLSVNVVK